MTITNDDPLLTTKEAAAYLGSLSYRTLEGLRLRGGGPRFVKVGRSVYYRRSALDQWPESEHRSTSDPGENRPTSDRGERASTSA